ncbi:MAG: AAA ATPase [Candidatus Woesebacteria bacterium GW2011_GWA1_33_30]|uniref:AAA ATPase n=1 Tax=Candidatus Woesebacteria bacterium GW2011_GWA2_33_28 TaxID=1618561 RepID=A0A0F9ZUL2_9BACT|nr:MAG: AAA ATPase [Candidatus Woesebacteria bacterium GW2011_GWA2_33_28]KKP48747.1 MAG: AAA ATPase [Candidatus Woesebacteria bacterium GW2011_GWA1_33_30]KKP50020.1 MAG: AAA ATPase [Microgenomates group bacterium GW2011_GWC1_33_32]KKP51791.1 MAG: AAA ATPase [Candidatus Woesebacteria bacterium GW2011_GWB1_33_38]KKP58595.1 MAG: AAA ATPase [Microgenomates group bacterium GW2011_GWD1_33_9]
MNIVKRDIEDDIEEYLKSDGIKTLFIWGPRRSGKTTLIDNLAKKLKVTKYNFDLASDRDKFQPRRDILEKIASENKVILIDEVQNYPASTVMLKLLHDEFKKKVIATGSSELRQKTGQEFDTMAGRFNEIYCLPLSISEIVNNESPKSSEMTEFTKKMVINSQIWGMYPEVYSSSSILSESKRIDLLQKILDTYILKDVVDIYELKNQKLAKDILTKIALQLGSEVSLNEIAKSLNAYPATVSNYIEIFIKNYILIPMPSFKTNMRRAVSENRKLYFYDLGIRNALIQDFRDLDLRQDKGGVFENFVIIELEKLRRITNTKINFYFYREYGGKEIDIVIEDYKKNYITVEVKSKTGRVQDIFPIKNRTEVITTQNYYEKIKSLNWD